MALQPFTPLRRGISDLLPLSGVAKLSVDQDATAVPATVVELDGLACVQYTLAYNLIIGDHGCFHAHLATNMGSVMGVNAVATPFLPD